PSAKRGERSWDSANPAVIKTWFSHFDRFPARYSILCRDASGYAIPSVEAPPRLGWIESRVGGMASLRHQIAPPCRGEASPGDRIDSPGRRIESRCRGIESRCGWKGSLLRPN